MGTQLTVAVSVYFRVLFLKLISTWYCTEKSYERGVNSAFRHRLGCGQTAISACVSASSARYATAKVAGFNNNGNSAMVQQLGTNRPYPQLVNTTGECVRVKMTHHQAIGCKLSN